jgi:nucleoside-diphosphate-sugar epimerase
VGARVVGDALLAAGFRGPVLYGSSLHVYGQGVTGAVGPESPYGEQGDLAHLSKVYAELCLRMYARRGPLCVGLVRLAIVFGPSPVEHDDPEHVTVVDKFRRMAAAGRALTLDDGGRATIGVVHADDAARILLDWSPVPASVEAVNLCAESVTVADVAALAEGRAPAGGAARSYPSPFTYGRSLRGYLAP